MNEMWRGRQVCTHLKNYDNRVSKVNNMGTYKLTAMQPDALNGFFWFTCFPGMRTIIP